MKNHELLDIIGDVNEDYVRAADADAAYPRSRWRAWAAAAACVALIAAAYPVSRAFQPQTPGPEASQGPADTLVQRPGLHSYFLVEGGRQIMFTQTTGGEKLPSFPHAVGGGAVDAPAPSETAVPPGSEQSGDVPVQEGAYYYERLMQGMGVPTDGSPAVYPEWFGGAWLEGEQGELLAVGVVEEDRTPELEAQIRDWTGEAVVLHSVKYSQNYLDGLMEGIRRVFEELDCRISSVYGVYVMDNYLGLEFYGEAPADEVLAALAGLDPEGDAIRIQVFLNGRIDFTVGSNQSHAPAPASAPVAEDGQDYPVAEPSAAPGGAVRSAVNDLEEGTEGSMPARYDTQPAKADDLPQAKYDVISGVDE